jgi:hypothetical protein
MPYVLLPKARRLALAACAAASSMAIAATAHATVILPDNYFGGLNNHDHLDVINGDTRFDISSASIQRIGTGGGTLEVVINTNYAGMPGTPAAIGTGYGALFLTPGAHAWHPTGVAPYPTDVFTPGEWAYAFTIPGIPTASTGSGGLYLTSGGTIVMSNIHGNPVSAPTPGNPGFYFRQGQAVQFRPGVSSAVATGSWSVGTNSITFDINDGGLLGNDFALAWAMTCANDVIQGQVDIPETKGGVPEPATWAMLVVGFGSLGAVARGQRRKRARTA